MYLNIPRCLSPKHKRAVRKCNDLQGEMKIKKVGFNVEKAERKQTAQTGERGFFTFLWFQ